MPSPPADPQVTWENPGARPLPPREQQPEPGPPILPYRPGQPIPPGYVLSATPTSDIVIVGVGAAGVAYGLGVIPTVGILLLGGDKFIGEGMWALLVPGIGPFIATGLLKAEGEAAGVLIASGLVQSAGIVIGLVGLATAEGPRLLRVHTASRLTISPGVAGAPGLSVRMSF